MQSRRPARSCERKRQMVCVCVCECVCVCVCVRERERERVSRDPVLSARLYDDSHLFDEPSTSCVRY